MMMSVQVVEFSPLSGVQGPEERMDARSAFRFPTAYPPLIAISMRSRLLSARCKATGPGSPCGVTCGRRLGAGGKNSQIDDQNLQ